MILCAVEIVIFAGLGIYLVRWRAAQRRKSTNHGIRWWRGSAPAGALAI